MAVLITFRLQVFEPLFELAQSRATLPGLTSSTLFESLYDTLWPVISTCSLKLEA